MINPQEINRRQLSLLEQLERDYRRERWRQRLPWIVIMLGAIALTIALGLVQ